MPDEELDELPRRRLERYLRSVQQLLADYPTVREIDLLCAKPVWRIRELPVLLRDIGYELCNALGVDPNSLGLGGRPSSLEHPPRTVISEPIAESPPAPGVRE